MIETSPLPDSADPWGPTDETPLIGVKVALLLGAGAMALLFSLST